MDDTKERLKEQDEFNYKKLLIRTLLGTVALVLLFVAVGMIFKAPLNNYSKLFVDNYGIYAVFSGFFVTAISPVPLPDHALSAFALIGGMNFIVNVGISTLGSLSGGIMAYYLGRLAKNTRLYKKLMKRYRAKSENLINKHGVKGLAIACLTPIPDSPVMWICGTLDLPIKNFVVTVLICRAIKIAYALWFIQLGLMTI